MPFPIHRSRRLRRNARLRAWVAETRLSVDRLVQPLFICPGNKLERPIASLPGQAQLSPDRAATKAAALLDLGVTAVILFLLVRLVATFVIAVILKNRKLFLYGINF